MTFINTLPDEILLEVFKLHVLTDSQYNLLQVCRRWHSITIEGAMLWCDIACTNVTKGYRTDGISFDAEGNRLDDRLKSKVMCSTPKVLATAIKRTKSYPFYLTLYFPDNYSLKHWVDTGSMTDEWKAVQESISHRCHRLTLLPEFKFESNSDKLKFANFAALERLDVYEVHNWVEILDCIEQTSMELQEVTIEQDESSAFFLNVYSKLVSRIRSLCASTHFPIRHGLDLLPAPLLETLQLRSSDGFPQYFGIPSGMSSLCSLWITNTSLELVNESVLNKLEHLVIETTTSFYQHDEKYELPNLKHLELVASWATAPSVLAPVLQSLTLRDGGSHKLQSNATSLQESTLRPRKLYIDIGTEDCLEEKDLIFLVRNQWSDLDDLQLVYTLAKSRYGKVLSTAFLGTKTHAPVCLSLVKLVVLFPKAEKLQKDANARREQAITRLTSVVDARREGGILKTVEFGWYDANSDTEIEDPIIDWAVYLD